MISEYIVSLKDNIHRRITNPFLGTFTVVYIIKNWELFYSIFNFEDKVNLEYKLNYIRDYFRIHTFGWNLLESVGYSFLVLLSTYLFLALGRYISNMYISTVEPFIYKITDKSKIVLKVDYKKLLEEKIMYEAKYENERLEKSKIVQDRENMEKQYLTLISKNASNEVVNNLRAEVESIKSQLSAKNDEIQSLKKQSKDKDSIIQRLDPDNKSKLISVDDNSIKSLAIILYQKIKEMNLFEKFDNFSNKALNGDSTWSKPKDINFFIENKIFRLSRSHGIPSEYVINFTDIGENIHNLRLMDLNNVNQ